VLLAPPVVSFLSPDYARGASIVPWLVLGYVLWGFYQVPMNVITLVSGKTRYVWMLGSAAAAVNIGALYVFVPEHGIIAAGTASALGYLVLLVMTIIYARLLRLRPGLDRRRILAGTALCAGAYAIARLLPESGATGLTLRGAAVVVVVLALAPLCGFRLVPRLRF
jgi:O-antigen/teichoic acid export membrane protein